MAAIKVLEASFDEDLQPLSAYWWKQQLPHRITEQSGKQVVWVDDAELVPQLLSDYDAFASGALQITVTPRQVEGSVLSGVWPFVSEFPVTFALVLLSIAGFLLVVFDGDRSLVNWLTIQSVGSNQLAANVYAVSRVSPAALLEQGEYWRLFTPVFLHFGWLHITFNMLWLWELGRRIEKQGGAIHFASIVFFIGVASNLYQAASTPFAYFGGMSGVIFGLLGYCAVFNVIAPRKLLRLPREYYFIMFLTLVVGWLGILDSIAKMANTAHTTGFLWGCFIAVPSAILARVFWQDDTRAQ